MTSTLDEAWASARKKLLFPACRHPYYIAAPRWKRGDSAGIRALYLLCHALNRAGQAAYLLVDSQKPTMAPPELLVPPLTRDLARKHFQEGRTPITVYPETLAGNPYGSPVVARWILNFPGLLGGDATFDSAEMLFGYSGELAQSVGQPERVLHLPTVDTRVFHPAPSDAPRQGACFYAYKYRKFHPEGALLPVTEGATEITKGLPDSQTPREIAELFRRSEVFYAYENTILVFEAILCGCPAVFLPNEHLTQVIGAAELGTDGYAWGTDPEQVAQARATVPQGVQNFLRTYDLFWEQLDRFIALTQARAEQVGYPSPLRMPTWWRKQMEKLRKRRRRS